MTRNADSNRNQLDRASLEEIDLGDMDAVNGGCERCGGASAGAASPRSAMVPTRNDPTSRR